LDDQPREGQRPRIPLLLDGGVGTRISPLPLCGIVSLILHRGSIIRNFDAADGVAVDVEQRLRIAVVTANQIALGLEVDAIRHDFENAGQFTPQSLPSNAEFSKSILITSFMGVPFG
jgi:hypothetical protein